MLVPLAAVGCVSLWMPLTTVAGSPTCGSTGPIPLLAASLASLQLVLDRGQRLDWLDSSEIIIEIVIGCCAFDAFLIHSFMADRPSSISGF